MFAYPVSAHTDVISRIFGQKGDDDDDKIENRNPKIETSKSRKLENRNSNIKIRKHVFEKSWYTTQKQFFVKKDFFLKDSGETDGTIVFVASRCLVLKDSEKMDSTIE